MDGEKTKYPGVYQRVSKTRRHAGRADVCFYLHYKVGTGKRWEKVGWKSEGITAAYAAQVRTERIRSIRLGAVVPVAAKPMTFAAAFERYRADHLSRTKSERGVTSMYRSGVEPFIGNMMLGKIKPTDVERIIAAAREQGLAVATQRHFVSIIRAVYRKMLGWGLYRGECPTSGVAMPRQDNARQRWLRHEEADALLAGLRARSEDVYCMALLSLHTGLRAGEIFALRGEHVNLQEGTIAVVDPKGVVNRVAYLTQAAREMLAGRIAKPGELVFPAKGGGMRADMSDTFARVVDALGLNDGLADRRDQVVFHTLRHTFASWMVMQGVPLYTVGQLMGHSDSIMTQRYAKLSPDTKRAAVAAIEQAIAARQ